jgi:hypothetical protein
MPIETWTTLGTLLGVGLSLFLAMRTEMRAMEHRLTTRIDGVEVRIDRLDDRICRLDDRVYALAVGLKPAVEAARAEES